MTVGGKDGTYLCVIFSSVSGALLNLKWSRGVVTACEFDPFLNPSRHSFSFFFHFRGSSLLAWIMIANQPSRLSMEDVKAR